jgi:hypothetical protein
MSKAAAAASANTNIAATKNLFMAHPLIAESFDGHTVGLRFGSFRDGHHRAAERHNKKLIGLSAAA